MSLSVPDQIRAPGRRLVTAALAGAIAGGVAVAVFTIDGDFRTATEQVFSLGALAFGLGLLGWSGSVMAGTGIENMQRYMKTRSNWTEADSRRAMTRLIGFGLGVMLVASVSTVGL